MAQRAEFCETHLRAKSGFSVDKIRGAATNACAPAGRRAWLITRVGESGYPTIISLLAGLRSIAPQMEVLTPLTAIRISIGRDPERKTDANPRAACIIDL
jgi:hypothetical protein